VKILLAWPAWHLLAFVAFLFSCLLRQVSCALPCILLLLLLLLLQVIFLYLLDNETSMVVLFSAGGLASASRLMAYGL
jgi:hypothetical protein